jgi:hypothetical protein
LKEQIRVAKTIVGSFDSYEEARRVMRELEKGGFDARNVSLLANNVNGGQLPPHAPATLSDPGTGAASGAATGGALGGAAGLAVGLMGLVIPGVGPIVAAGPLAATLAGAGIGAVAGGLIGGLTNAGVPEEEAHAYAEAVRRGGALVTVRSEDARAEVAAGIMRSCGALDIKRRAELWREQGWTRHDANATPYTPAQVQHERSLRSGSPVHTAYSPGANAANADDWRIHSGYLRLWHNDNYGGTEKFEEYEPAYRYGWGLGLDERYRDRSWPAIETDARRDWEQRYPNNSWQRFKGAVRRGWERTTAAVERATPGDSDHDGR